MRTYQVTIWLGVICGLSGTWILSSKLAAEAKWRRYAFWIYLGSNFAIGYVSLHAHMWGVLAMQVVYTGFSIRGIWVNREVDLFAPLKPSDLLGLPSCKRRIP